MAISTELLNEFRGILLEEYGLNLSETELLSEALRLHEFGKNVLRFKLTELTNK